MFPLLTLNKLMWTEYSRVLQEKKEQLKNIGIKKLQLSQKDDWILLFESGESGFYILNCFQLDFMMQTLWQWAKTSCAPRPLSAGRRLNLQPNFLKRGGLAGPQLLEGFAGKEEVTFFMRDCNFHIKNKLKSEIFNDKESL